MNMQLIWNRFNAWINRYTPHLSEDIQDGVTMDMLQLLETKIGKKLPIAFCDFYLIHNGQDRYADYIVDAEELLSVERMLEEWNIWKGLLDSKHFEENGKAYTSYPQKGIKNDWWNPYWLPITYNGAGDHFCLDLDPAPEGNYGQIIRMWHDSAERELEANSFEEWIEAYVTGLEKGEYVYSKEWAGIVHKEEIEAFKI